MTSHWEVEFQPGTQYLSFVRAFIISLLLFSFLPIAEAATGKVLKVLPHFEDNQGRIALTPSLYDRDAYQAVLRRDPTKRSGLRFDIQYKAKGPVWQPLTIRVELRGIAQGNLPKELVLQKTVDRTKWFNRWTSIKLTDTEYQELGEVTAWRVTLWEGDWPLGEVKSFLW